MDDTEGLGTESCLEALRAGHPCNKIIIARGSTRSW